MVSKETEILKTKGHERNTCTTRMLATSFRCATGCNELKSKGLYIPGTRVTVPIYKRCLAVRCNGTPVDIIVYKDTL